jgi:hypothetical protein
MALDLQSVRGRPNVALESKPHPASGHAAALRTFLCGDTALRAVDVLLWLAGAAFGFALAESFLDWLARPLDADALIALGIILAFVASFCWFLRMMFLLVLRPRLCSLAAAVHQPDRSSR